MGNCFAINVNISCDKLFSLCCPQEAEGGGAPRRKIVLNDLRNDWERLKAARVDTLRKIDESRQMRPLEQVNHWLLRVGTLEDQVRALETNYVQDQESSNNQCFRGYCPRDCRRRYKLWRNLQLTDQEVHDLLSQIPQVAVERPLLAPAMLVPTEATSSGMQLMLNKVMLNKVWSHVEDEQDIGSIGLWGMGGVGKTTLLKAINNKLCNSPRSFDLQLWIVVSKSPDLVDIQNHIGEKIGFGEDAWKGKSPEAKAMDIHDVLHKKKYVLLLDDIWERFDLIKIGIPLPNLQNKSKIIFTTRSKQVCGQMKARQIQVECLNEEEAWNLFKENVGEEALNAHRDIPGLAKSVMRECGGLPLTLSVIGRAMTCKRLLMTGSMPLKY